MTIDHIKKFRESEAGKRWHEASAEAWFHEGINVALLNLYLPMAQDMGQAAANNWREEGARQLAQRLVNLTEIKEPPKAPAMKSLLPV
jgi:hypothetical protein